MKPFSAREQENLLYSVQELSVVCRVPLILQNAFFRYEPFILYHASLLSILIYKYLDIFLYFW